MVIRDVCKNADTLKFVDNAVEKIVQTHISSRKGDTGALPQFGLSAGSRFGMKLDWVRNLISKATPSGVQDDLNEEGSSAFALFWNIICAVAPPEVLADFNLFLTDLDIRRMDGGGKMPHNSKTGQGNYTVKIPNFMFTFHGAELAPPAGVCAQNYTQYVALPDLASFSGSDLIGNRFIHLEHQPHTYSVAWTTSRNMDTSISSVDNSGNFFLASHGVRIQAAENSLLIWKPALWHRTSLCIQDPDAPSTPFCTRGLAFVTSSRLPAAWKAYRANELTMAAAEELLLRHQSFVKNEESVSQSKSTSTAGKLPPPSLSSAPKSPETGTVALTVSRMRTVAIKEKKNYIAATLKAHGMDGVELKSVDSAIKSASAAVNLEEEPMSIEQATRVISPKAHAFSISCSSPLSTPPETPAYGLPHPGEIPLPRGAASNTQMLVDIMPMAPAASHGTTMDTNLAPAPSSDNQNSIQLELNGSTAADYAPMAVEPSAPSATIPTAAPEKRSSGHATAWASNSTGCLDQAQSAPPSTTFSPPLSAVHASSFSPTTAPASSGQPATFVLPRVFALDKQGFPMLSLVQLKEGILEYYDRDAATGMLVPFELPFHEYSADANIFGNRVTSASHSHSFGNYSFIPQSGLHEPTPLPIVEIGCRVTSYHRRHASSLYY
ncbi:hypothetical protein D9756_005720 [Leucocoprinus leucothites]|uniref:Uncharacterized protein n=1 Tax=Leucocoprinus leucothites TaxID=201217 RepID=A0A8H5D9M8_9AGAR|nr:hypothetical protein D9756_005720 [Leucoagaricus leucothites]